MLTRGGHRARFSFGDVTSFLSEAYALMASLRIGLPVIYRIGYVYSMLDITGAQLLRRARLRAGLAQGELAARAGTSQSAIARLETGASNPTLATLQRLVAAAGFDVRVDLVPKVVPDPLVEAYKRDVDRSLLRENLRRSVDDRLRSLEDWQQFGEELERAASARSPESRRRGKP